MKAFVTGSTGLLGNNLVRLLRENGHEVKALVRSPEKAAKLLGDTGAQFVTGDMENVDGFKAALEGSDILFHAAAYFREYYGPGDHWGTLERINVQGTLQILEAAEKAGIKKVIYVSSSTVIGFRADGQPSDESTPLDPSALYNLYRKSKVVAENAIADFQKTHHIPIVQILPTAIFGPGDIGPTSTGKLILEFLTRKLPAVPAGGFSMVDARDVAQAMLNAFEHGKDKERYIVSNGYISLADILERMEKMTSVPAPRIHVPYAVMLAMAYMAEMRTRITGADSVMSVDAIRILHEEHKVSGAKTIRELGVTMHTVEQTLRDEINWYVQNGYVPTALKQVFVTA